MRMHMRDALARIYTILNGDVEGGGIVHSFDSPRDALDGQEEVLDFGGR